METVNSRTYQTMANICHNYTNCALAPVETIVQHYVQTMEFGGHKLLFAIC